MPFLSKKLPTPLSRILSRRCPSPRSQSAANIDSRNRPGKAIPGVSCADDADPPPYTAAAATDSQAPYLHPVEASLDTVSPLSFPPAAENRRYGTDDKYAFLTKFDTIFLVDDSSSMAGQLWREAGEAIAAITPICTKYDPDGIDIFFLNHRSTFNQSGGGYHSVKSPSSVQGIFRSVKPMDATPVGQRLREILFPYLHRIEKMAANTDEYGNLLNSALAVRPINVIVITDGAFSDDAESVILNAARTLDRCQAIPWQIGIQFLQIGEDRAAGEHLKQLDDELGKAAKHDHVRDIVDTVPWKEGTGRTLSADGILKVVLGAVNKRLDRQVAHS
uniref:VWFA domain-containing protein n=1 Tax=Talaromyces marneffei PM1 TaxID=1077442 RepID=A0A093UMA2_TALMA